MKLGIQAKLVLTLLLAGLLPLGLSLTVILVSAVDLRTSSSGRTYRALAQERAAHLSSILGSQSEVVDLLNSLPGTRHSLEIANGSTALSLASRQVMRGVAAVCPATGPSLPPAENDIIAGIESAWPSLDENSPFLSSILGCPLSHRWQAARANDPHFSEVLITDTTGRLVAASNKSSDYFQADESWWQDAYNNGRGRTLISDVKFDESAISPGGGRGLLVVDLSTPIYADKSRSKVLGIVKVSLDATWMFKQLDLPVGADETPRRVWMVDDNGKAVPGGVAPPAQVLPSLLANMVNKEELGWAVEPQLIGHELLGFARVERASLVEEHGHRWHVVVAVNHKRVLQPVYRLAWIIILLGAGLLAICFLAGLAISRREIVNPVRALRQAVDQLKAGQRDFRLPEPGQADSPFRNDEIGQLARVFNVMADRLRQQVEQLEEADAIKRQFIDLASHELRTPVTFILGAAQLGQRNNPDDGQILARISQKALRLTRIVENMFKLLGGERFDRRLRTASVDLRDIIQSVVQEHDPFLVERHQQWNLNLPSQLPAIEADPDKVRDIVANLASNAIRFSPDGAIIGISAQPLDQGVEITVTDQGPGVAQDDLPNLFQPFFTGAGLRQSSGDYQFMSRGMGLGLSVVKRFVDLHGGTIRVDTSAAGTAIHVTFPLAPPPENPAFINNQNV